MKRTRTVAALAAVALIVALTATAHASGGGDAQGPKPFAECGDILKHALSTAGTSGESDYQFHKNGESDPNGDLTGEPGEVYRSYKYLTRVRVEIQLVDDPCLGADGVWGTTDDRVSFLPILLHPEQDPGGNWTATEIEGATLTTPPEDGPPNPNYSIDASTGTATATFTYDLPYGTYVSTYTERTSDPTAVGDPIDVEDDGYTYSASQNDGPDVCGEARSMIDLGQGFLSDVSPDLDADGSRVVAKILEFCEDSSGASAKSG